MLRLAPLLLLAGCHTLLPFASTDGRSGESLPPAELGLADIRPGERGADAPLDRGAPDRRREGALPVDKSSPLDGPPPDSVAANDKGGGIVDARPVEVELDTSDGRVGPGPYSMTIAPKSCPAASCLLVVGVAVLGGAVSTVTCGSTGLTKVAECNFSGTSSSIWVLKSLASPCVLKVQAPTTAGVAASSIWRNVALSKIGNLVYCPGAAAATTVAQTDIMSGGALVDAAAVPIGAGISPTSGATPLRQHKDTGFSGAVGYGLADATGSVGVGWSLAAGTADWSHAHLLLSPKP